MSVDLAEVKRLRPQAGDVVVIRCEDRIDAPSWERITETVKGVLPEGVKVLIIEGGMDVDLVRAGEKVAT